jgi:hypothetical protein
MDRYVPFDSSSRAAAAGFDRANVAYYCTVYSTPIFSTPIKLIHD